MKYVGADLHKRIIALCVVVVKDSQRAVVRRKTLRCSDVAGIEKFFRELGPFQVVVEATASYEWFVQLVEPLASRVVLAHPKKLRVIAESTRKSDKVDAQVLAEFLALGMIPEAYRPTPRVREHRNLVRYRRYVDRRITSVKNKLRRKLADYNADVPQLFSAAGRQHIEGCALSASDRFVVEQLLAELEQHQERLGAVNRQLQAFAQQASVAEREARAVLESMPCVGPVTIDVVLSELGDVERFRSQKRAASFSGLVPGHRASAGHSHELGITKEGSRILRWGLVELGWRLVGKTRRWGLLYERLKAKKGAKRAIVAVARRVLCVMISMLRSGELYRLESGAMKRRRGVNGPQRRGARARRKPRRVIEEGCRSI